MDIMTTYHGYNNGHKNPMYNAYKNVGTHSTWQNTVLSHSLLCWATYSWCRLSLPQKPVSYAYRYGSLPVNGIHETGGTVVFMEPQPTLLPSSLQSRKKYQLIFVELLLSARHCLSHCTCIHSFNPRVYSLKVKLRQKSQAVCAMSHSEHMERL